MMKQRDFLGQIEEIPKDIYEIISTANPILILHLSTEGELYSGGASGGSLQVRRRGNLCLTLNSHEPRPFIVCWNDGANYTDISFHREMGGERGALDALKRMFERYTGRGT